jgi:hypothetical protein
MKIVRDFCSCPAAHCDSAAGMPRSFLSMSQYKVLMILYGTVVIVSTKIVKLTADRLQQRVSKYSRYT